MLANVVQELTAWSFDYVKLAGHPRRSQLQVGGALQRHT
jgi:hypothetical protein